MKAGKYLKKIRLQKKLSQSQLGVLIGKKSVRISEWENDKYAIKLSEFIRIAHILNIKNFNSVFKD